MSASPLLSSQDIERFRAVLALRLGLRFDEGKFEYLAGVLESRLRENNEGVLSYLARLESSAQGRPEFRNLAKELTVGETYFFRHTDQFRAFAEVALPSRAEARAASRQLRILSAGCSSGEEGYTLSILTRQHFAGAKWDIAINGVDLNPKAIERARRARYSNWALRETPEDMQKRYFVPEGREYALIEEIRASVTFDEQNLIGEEAWPLASYDVVFCRNVIMYFTPDQAQRVVNKFAHALAPGGYLFLGYAENLRGVSQDFDLLHTHGTFYYQRKAGHALANAPIEHAPLMPLSSNGPLAADWASTWLDTVQRSAERIRTLTEKRQVALAPAPVAAPSSPADVTLALELLAHERFSEALDVLSRLPTGASADADTVLLRAALLTHSGKLEQAESACSELLALDSLNAGAHYLRALCRERSGDARGAVEHAQTASYLDPTFAMPHLHLGLMARRAGDRASAQRELTSAAALLQLEDASRLLLFGGGFHRDGLVALCRSELERLGIPA